MPSVALLLPLVVLLTAGSLPPLGPSEPLGTASRACDVTFEGRHGGASGQIAVDFGESQVRTRAGWWAPVPPRGAAPTTVTLSPGGLFAEAYRLDLACGAHRRYRFAVVADVGGTRVERTVHYPSEDGFTQETVIDLGALARHFEGIAPAPDAEPGPVALGGVPLEGEWVRTESNNDPNDGMRLRVEGDRAVLTHVPPTAHAAWRAGSVVWRGLAADGSLRVLGSDGDYYPSRIEADGPDRLRVRVGHGGAGNAQTWTRAEGCWPDAYMAAYEAPAPDLWVRFSTGLPDGFQAALRGARDAGAPVQTAALTPSGEWVVVAANRPCYSAGFPADAREWIDRYIADGREIDVVAFGPGGRWLVVAEDLLRRTSNVSDDVMEAVRRAQGQGRRLTSFAFSDDPDEGWVFTAGGGLYARTSTAFDPDIREAMAAANAGRRPLHEVAIAPGGAWALVAEDWYATRGAPDGLREWLERYRTDEGRRIDHVVLHPDGGRLLWALISNGPEPAPDAADLVNRVEHGLPGDSTIYQRMRHHGITGLSLALVQDNELAWARGYGLREFDLPESYVYPKTVFDAASISKPVSYAAALQLVDAGALALTEAGVLLDLAGDELPDRSALEAIRADEIHLAHLLAHCAGVDNRKGRSGAQEIDTGDPVPTLAQIFLGQSPAAAGNRVVRVDTVEVGEVSDYSDAHSLLVQALVEDAAEGGYDGQMERLFDALAMHRSRVDHDFWRTTQRAWFARGHWTDSTGTTTKADVKVYPNQTAAALRTTAPDLAQFVIMLNEGGTFGGARVLEAATVDRFLGRDGVGVAEGVAEAACARRGSMQLGIRARGLGTDGERFWHGGLHNGYRTYLAGLPRQRGGLVLLITGRQANADALRDEIRVAVGNAYGWPTP